MWREHGRPGGLGAQLGCQLAGLSLSKGWQWGYALLWAVTPSSIMRIGAVVQHTWLWRDGRGESESIFPTARDDLALQSTAMTVTL